MAVSSVFTRERKVKAVTEHKGVDLELLFLTEVVGLRSLHYGYWDSPPADVDLTLPALKEAQTRFTERLLAMIPAGVKSVLDVGSGVGDNAREMLRRGLDVTALSPDRNHEKFYEAMKGQGVVFHNRRFEDLEFRRRFDLLLMSESQNYFDQRIGLETAIRHLEPDGRLLIAGQFRRRDSREFKAVRCIEEPYIALAAEHGFHLVRSVDVTENVIGTLRLAERYLRPVLHVAQTYLETGSFLKRWLAGLLIAKRSMSPRRLREYYEQWISPEYYRTHVKYAFLLFARRH
jgi:SAM-dependent methyltransferase